MTLKLSPKFGTIIYTPNRQDPQAFTFKLTGADAAIYDRFTNAQDELQIHLMLENKNNYSADTFVYYPKGDQLTRPTKENLPLFNRILDCAINLPLDIKKQLVAGIEAQLNPFRRPLR